MRLLLVVSFFCIIFVPYKKREIMRKYKRFTSPERVNKFLEELEENGVLAATIHITEDNDFFTVFYKDKSRKSDL